jgi:tetratricopeptide (TPR) repeat protein
LSLYGRRKAAYDRAVSFIKAESFSEALTFIRRQSRDVRDWPGLSALEAGLISASSPKEALAIYDRLLNGKSRDRHWARALAGYRFLVTRLAEEGDFAARARLVRCLAFEWRNAQASDLISATLLDPSLPGDLKDELESFQAVLALRSGKFQEAASYFSRKGDLSSLRWLSTVRMRQGSFREAAELRDKAAGLLKAGRAREREEARVFDILTKGGLYEEAVAYLKQHGDLKSRIPAWNWYLALSLLASRRPEEALAHLAEEQGQLGARGQRAQYFKGRALEALIRQPEAAEVYRKSSKGALAFSYYGLLSQGRLASLEGQAQKKPTAQAMASLLYTGIGQDYESMGYYLWLSEKIPWPWPDLAGESLERSPLGEADRSKAAIGHYLSQGRPDMAVSELKEAVSSLIPKKAAALTPEMARWALLSARTGQYGLALKILGAIGLGKYDPENPRLRWSHPLVLSGPVLEAYRHYGLPPQVTLSVIRTESAFEAEAISASNARGLMQILPSTSMRLGALLGTGEPKEEDLFQPEINIALGTYYLYLLKEAFGELSLALASYNGGPFNVRSLLEARPGLPLDVFVETLPFSETSDYVKRVMESLYLYELAYLGQGNLPDLTRPALPGPGQVPDF